MVGKVNDERVRYSFYCGSLWNLLLSFSKGGSMKRHTLSVILLSLSVMACGMTLPTQPESVNKTVLINTPELSPVPVPSVQLPEKATVCGGWNVRETADPDSEWQSYILPNSPVTLTGKTANAPDGGKWVQLVDRDGKKGWMNVKGLCHD